MLSQEAIEIAAIVDQFSERWRKELLASTNRLAEVYFAIGAERVPLAEARRKYRESHPDEIGGADTEGERGTVISLAEHRRRTAGRCG